MWIITLKQVSNQLHKTSHWLIVTSINNVQRGGQQLQSMYFSWFPSVWSPAFPDNCSFAQFFFFLWGLHHDTSVLKKALCKFQKSPKLHVAFFWIFCTKPGVNLQNYYITYKYHDLGCTIDNAIFLHSEVLYWLTKIGN